MDWIVKSIGTEEFKRPKVFPVEPGADDYQTSEIVIFLDSSENIHIGYYEEFEGNGMWEASPEERPFEDSEIFGWCPIDNEAIPSIPDGFFK